MDVNCDGCAGCCIDWRPLAPDADDHERRGRRPPLDDAYNLVPLSRDEVRDFLDAGYGDVMTPRLWEATDGDDAVTVDGHDLVAVGDRPVFFLGLRKPPKPVGPFGLDRHWLDTCVFLDPETLRCRIHDSPLYPRTCSDYPGQNLALDRETECERVEMAYGGDRLLDDTPPDNVGLALGPQALGAKLFVYPDPEELTGVVDRLLADELTAADRARFVGVAVGSSPGTTTVDGTRAEEARTEARAADSWAGQAIEAWEMRADETGSLATDVESTGATVEEARGAPETEG
ncbi:hypothetical protein SAMN04487948_103358 [Halogranum amylolyticum]|uniref:Uncharacterized protein n=1 Tax=Halogranum amylolyticum TaxID=660520 RepID=A0A1H8QY39_9EURY|nr:YkgJ family cysteine cluster protein [Halogranum amylolyticum]SEO58623.1 hypothetical protein SAMN04487948_103358 [Halogranum amylolyticum]